MIQIISKSKFTVGLPTTTNTNKNTARPEQQDNTKESYSSNDGTMKW
jgi:hypothetical protein